MRIISSDTVIVSYKIVAQRYASFLLHTHWCEGTKKYRRSLLLPRYVNWPIFLKEYSRNRSIWHSVINWCCKRSATDWVYPSYTLKGFFLKPYPYGSIWQNKYFYLLRGIRIREIGLTQLCCKSIIDMTSCMDK